MKRRAAPNQTPLDLPVPPRRPSATISTLVLHGIDAVRVEVRAERLDGPFGTIEVVGLREGAEREARVRVRCALQSVLGHEQLPALRLSVSPAIPFGSVVDVAMLMASLVVLEKIPHAFAGTAILGELSLDGKVRPVRGVLPMLLGAGALGFARAIVPEANRAEALRSKFQFLTADNVSAIVNFARGNISALEVYSIRPGYSPRYPMDFAELRTHPRARRAAEIAAAGGHRLLLVEPSGDMAIDLGKRMPSILPDLLEDEAVRLSTVHSAAGLLHLDHGVLMGRPFRAPHHTCSEVGLLGGGLPPRPGEVSLANGGVLFLHEADEARRTPLEGLARAIRDGEITIARGDERVTFPARPLLLGAVRRCACGLRTCKCLPEALERRAVRIADLRAMLGFSMVVRLDGATETAQPLHEASAPIRARVEGARARQAERVFFPAPSGVLLNDMLSAEHIAKLSISGSGVKLFPSFDYTTPSGENVVRVAQTIADLEGSKCIRGVHLEEAMTFVPSAAPEAS